MPHFVIECSDNALKQKTADEIMQAVYNCAEASGMFAENDIKVRLLPFEKFKLADTKQDFLHVFGYIMEGRSFEEKADLSRAIIERLNELLPSIAILSMNISEFEKATYCNKALIHPQNTTGDRHFLI